MFIVPNQIRAARGLLDWTVAELGEKVGVGATTISAIETGRSAGSLEVLTAICYAFQSAGVIMTEDGGVKPFRGSIQTYGGQMGFRSFIDDVYETSKNSDNPDICVTNTDEKLYDQWLGSYEPYHVNRMAALGHVKPRVLIKEGDLNPCRVEYVEYRCVPKHQFSDVSLYIYDCKSAFIEFLENDVVVTVVNNKAVTDSLRKMFEYVWSNMSAETENENR